MNFCSYFALLFVMLSCILTCTNSDYRIVGGCNWNIVWSSHLVSIHFNDRNHCVGSLVTAEKVVTAANCVAYLDVDLFVVAAGVTDLRYIGVHGQFRTVERVRYPCTYNADTHDMDIAVMKVHVPFNLGHTVRTIKFCDFTFEKHREMRVSGWGWTIPEDGRTSYKLQSAVLTSLKYNDCKDRYSTRGRILTRSMICAAHPTADVCVKDSGAPGVVDGKLCAVVSFNLGCAKPDYPSVFTVVNNVAVRAFLNETIKLL